jgi:hypothetical protein
MLPWRAIRRHTEAHHRAMAEERTRIYERMLVMEYLLDQRRSAAIALLMLNDVESANIQYGMALGSDALGIMCDTVGMSAWAEAYHHQALRTSLRLQDPRLVGIAYFGLAYHEQRVGKWCRASDLLMRVLATTAEC